MKRNNQRIKPLSLSLDKAYSSKKIFNFLSKRKIEARIPNKINTRNKRKLKKRIPFRWKVERTFAWINSFRAVRTCYELNKENYLALCKLACSIIILRKALR
jgi:transposase